jgi:hypothetical protein
MPGKQSKLVAKLYHQQGFSVRQRRQQFRKCSCIAPFGGNPSSEPPCSSRRGR